MTRNEFFHKVCEATDWDPYQPGLDHKIEIDVRKIYSAFRSYLKSAGLAEKLEKIAGENLNWITARICLANVYRFADGTLDTEFLLSSTEQGIQSNGMYPLKEELSLDWANAARESMIRVHEYRKTGATDFDMSKTTFELPGIGEQTALNSLLSTTTLPPIQVIVETVNNADSKITKAETALKDSNKQVNSLLKDLDTLKSEIGRMAASSLATKEKQTFESDGTIPDGTMEWVKASTLFPEVTLEVDFDVPFFTWDGVHPDVPVVDRHYIFRPTELSDTLYAIASNQRQYLHGHTGTGKTTLVEQVAARLNYPFIRLNFDSEITRMDLIGRDTMKRSVNPDGTPGETESIFVDGMLPRAMSSPCLLMLDELDFVRPDVAYVMQAACEGNGLRITEDGDRFIVPHEHFRLFASANTVGQGDEYGLYAGARPQSQALLDRFTVWTKVEYLKKKQRDDLIMAKVPALSVDDSKVLSQYVDEHLESFVNGTIIQPISPRGMCAIAQATVIFGNIKRALEQCVLNKANSEDRATLRGIIDRVCK